MFASKHVHVLPKNHTLTDKTGMNQSGQPFLVNVILVVASRLLLSTTFI